MSTFRRSTIEEQKVVLDKFLIILEEGKKHRREVAQELGINIDLARKWMRKIYPGKAANIFRYNKAPRVTKEVVHAVSPALPKKRPEMITIDFPTTPYEDPKKRMALSLLDNVESMLKTVREILKS